MLSFQIPAQKSEKEKWEETSWIRFVVSASTVHICLMHKGICNDVWETKLHFRLPLDTWEFKPLAHLLDGLAYLQTRLIPINKVLNKSEILPLPYEPTCLRKSQPQKCPPKNNK